MLNYIWFVCCLCFCLCQDSYENAVKLKDESQNGSEVMNGSLREVVKKYYCSVDDIQDEQTILYGSKSWTFPMQDVNLTLKYPSTNLENETEENEYIITGVLVILYIDGSRSSGYITKGGVFRDQISMTFIISRITRLSYQFWLYGVTKPSINISEFSWQQKLC